MMDSTAAVTALCWVPRGRAAAEPRKTLPTRGELEELLSEIKQRKGKEGREGRETAEEGESDDEKENENEDHEMGSQGSGSSEESDGDWETFRGEHLFSTLEDDLQVALNDPNLRIKGDEELSEDERDAERIRPTDCPLVAASTDGELPTLEIFIYDISSNAFYVHHEINIGSPVLCLELLNTLSSASGNYIATGTFESPNIEIWDLDTLDQLEPVVTLGKRKGGAGAQKKKEKVEDLSNGHSEAVLCLHANPINSNLLLSGSADRTVCLWDINTSPSSVAPASSQIGCLNKYKKIHRDKVQCCKWHPLEPTVFLSAGYDKRLVISDTRVNDKQLKTKLAADPESCIWDIHNPQLCWISCEDGVVRVFDVRNLEKEKGVGSSETVFSFVAHEGDSCSGIAQSTVPGLYVTSSPSGNAKIWKATAASASPELIFTKDLKGGPLLSVSSNPDEPTIFAFGGSTVVIWDVASESLIREVFSLPG